MQTRQHFAFGAATRPLFCDEAIRMHTTHNRDVFLIRRDLDTRHNSTVEPWVGLKSSLHG